jgi:hypothetical protein
MLDEWRRINCASMSARRRTLQKNGNIRVK